MVNRLNSIMEALTGIVEMYSIETFGLTHPEYQSTLNAVTSIHLGSHLYPLAPHVDYPSGA